MKNQLALVALVAFVMGLVVGDLLGFCKGQDCIWPLRWWRALPATDRASWAVADATLLLALIAAASPWLTVWASGAVERRKAERIAVHLVIALDPVLISLEARLRGVRQAIARFTSDPQNPLRWQVIPALRIPEAKELVKLQASFPYLEGLGFSLETIAGLTLQLDASAAALEVMGPAVLGVPDIDARVSGLDGVIEPAWRLISSLKTRIAKAARARSLDPLHAPMSPDEPSPRSDR